jgi:histidine triad (HIT) family protein
MSSQIYDPSNIFAKILRGELPCHKVYENATTLAFMDIMPRVDGHVLVIPKQPSRGLLDASPSTLAALMETVQIVGRATVAAMQADGLTIQQFNEDAGGQVVFHLHMHILPRKNGIPLRPHTGEMAGSDILANHAREIATFL